MANAVKYEWDVEEMDIFNQNEIYDHHHRDEGDLHVLLKEYGDNILSGIGVHRLVLVRDEGNDADGLADRSWAYVKDGALPEMLTDAAEVERFKVPKRLREEFERAVKNYSPGATT